MRSVRLVLLVAPFLLFSCAVDFQPYYLNEIAVRNNTKSILENVRLQSEATGRMFRCGNIAPGAQCSDSFTARPYQSNRISISWMYDGRLRKETHFLPEIPETMNRASPLRGVLEVKPDGSFTVYFEQNATTY